VSVRELIELLQQQDPDATVVAQSPLGHDKHPVAAVAVENGNRRYLVIETTWRDDR
jgi:hypothetical protein